MYTPRDYAHSYQPTVRNVRNPRPLTDAEYAAERDAAHKRIRARRLDQRRSAAQRRLDVDEALMREYAGSAQTAQAWRDNVEAHA